MKAINFHFGEMAVSGAWSRLAFPEFLGRLRPAARPQPLATVPRSSAPTRESIGLFERLDRWMYRLQQRERESWLSNSRDVFELEDRIRQLERSVGSRYY
jgi:hypothetical protein